MKIEAAAAALGALAHPERLAVLRLLVRSGEAGLPAGVIADALELSASTATFHLGRLVGAGLVARRRAGRQRIYSTRPAGLGALLGYVQGDCAQGRVAYAPAGGGRHLESLRAAAPRPVVAFVSMAGAVRGPLAEGLMRWNAGRRFDVLAVALKPAGTHPLVARALREIRVEPPATPARDLGAVLGQLGIEHAIVLCPEAERACRGVAPFARRREFWPLDDPRRPGDDEEAQLGALRMVRDALDERIRAWLRDRIQATTP
ncbi:MAG: metalloregulator ArsR/SmtB family transcription factor [Planctomycetota bacterium]|nr:metalloregulator ArsR/SmtB family transcription factor [Planctomycetota bacterium]